MSLAPYLPKFSGLARATVRTSRLAGSTAVNLVAPRHLLNLAMLCCVDYSVDASGLSGLHYGCTKFRP
eukprot:SAG31_NODE_24594_length_478_cov_0.870712_1_plen_67_part_10